MSINPNNPMSGFGNNNPFGFSGTPSPTPPKEYVYALPKPDGSRPGLTDIVGKGFNVSELNDYLNKALYTSLGDGPTAQRAGITRGELDTFTKISVLIAL